VNRREVIERIIEKYAPGQKAICYVDPNAPAEAVIDRGTNFSMFIGFVFLIFVAIGGLGFWYAPRWMGQYTGVKNAMPTAISTGGEAVEIHPQVTARAKFIGLLAFGLIWNGFISIFVYFIFFAPGHESTPIFAKIFIGFFVLIGLLIILAAFGSFLALFNPRVVLTTRTPSVPLGAEYRFQWKIIGPARKLKKLSIRLEGSEMAIRMAGRGSSHTSTQVFADIPVMEVLDTDLATEGEARVLIPANLMHTFKGSYNRIIWQLRLRCESPLLQALEEEYPITVLPAPISASQPYS
jgi:hypothetical protein